MAAVQKKNMYSIKSEADLHRLRDNLLNQFKEVNIKINPVEKPKKAKPCKLPKKKAKSQSVEGDDEKDPKPISSTIMTKKPLKSKQQSSNSKIQSNEGDDEKELKDLKPIFSIIMNKEPHNTKSQIAKPQTPSNEEGYEAQTEDDEEKEDDDEEGYFETTTKRGDMFDDVAEMQQSINIKDTELEKQLIMMEQQLINENAKKHVSRECHHPNCKNVAPLNYPQNIYLCDTHKAPFRQELEKYDIPCNRGSEEEKQKCIELKNSYQRVIDALKVPDNQQTFSKDQQATYPHNYFVVTMAKLMACNQELSKPLKASQNDPKLKESREKMKEIVKQLMDLLIIARQNLNCYWKAVVSLIVNIAASIGTGYVVWIATNAVYLAVLAGFVAFFVGLIIVGFMFCNDGKKLFCIGAAAVGVGVGGTVGFATAMWAGAELGAAAGTVASPGPGTLFGAAVGGLVAGGIAMMKKFG